jgi:hypothetical protein
MSPLITVRSDELVIPAEPPNTPNVEAELRGIAARQAPVAGTTVKLQVKSLAIVLAGIARSLTPVAPLLIVAE